MRLWLLSMILPGALYSNACSPISDEPVKTEKTAPVPD